MAPDEPTHAPRPPRDAETRGRDHDQIDRLTDELLPSLIDRLADMGLGEIEIREDDWRIRLRRPPVPAPGASGRGDRPADRHERGADRGADRGARPADLRLGTGELRDTGQPLRPAAGGAGDARGNGSAPGGGPASASGGAHRVIATSPSVGIFQARADVRPGSRVRAGDRVAAVDLLGVPQDVVAPEDGVVVETLVQPGDGVEYGQDLVVIEMGRGRHATGASPAAPPAPLTEA